MASLFMNFRFIESVLVIQGERYGVPPLFVAKITISSRFTQVYAGFGLFS